MGTSWRLLERLILSLSKHEAPPAWALPGGCGKRNPARHFQ